MLTLPLMVYCVYLLGGLVSLDYEAARQLIAAPSTALPLAVLTGLLLVCFMQRLVLR